MFCLKLTRFKNTPLVQDTFISVIDSLYKLIVKKITEIKLSLLLMSLSYADQLQKQIKQNVTKQASDCKKKRKKYSCEQR